MNIKKILEELEKFEDKIEWVEEPICDVKPILHELLKDDIKHWEGQVDLDIAVTNIIQYYKQGKVSVGFPNVVGFQYNNQTYYLDLVIGNVVFSKNKLSCRYGISHILDKHSKENWVIDAGSKVKEETLIEGIRNIKEAIDKGKPFINARDPERLAILHKDLLYIINFSNNPQYSTYLHNLFKPESNYLQKRGFNKTYIPTDSLKTI